MTVLEGWRRACSERLRWSVVHLKRPSLELLWKTIVEVWRRAILKLGRRPILELGRWAILKLGRWAMLELRRWTILELRRSLRRSVLKLRRITLILRGRESRTWTRTRTRTRPAKALKLLRWTETLAYWKLRPWRAEALLRRL